MKKSISCLLLVLLLSVNAAALEVPTSTVVQNLNGSQQLIKTYTLPPDADPQELIEAPFEQEGFLYTFSDITKEEHLAADSSYHTETVTLETETDDLAVIMERLSPTLEYDDGTYSGVLSLDHQNIRTEASGYETKSSTVSATKTIGPLDRNDMSYIPATTVKNGITLNLATVDWQVIGTDLVGDSLVPSSYQAVATYRGKSSHKAATGFVTTAPYSGEISRDGVKNVTYRLVYLGAELISAETPPDSALVRAGRAVWAALPYIIFAVGGGAICVLAVLLFRSNRELRRIRGDDEEIEESDQEVNAT